VAFEQVHGPLLIHERIDFGFAMLAWMMANAWGKRRRKFTDFLPPWYDLKPSGDVTEGFERLLRLGEENERLLSQRSPR
jgi:hypothetical protein